MSQFFKSVGQIIGVSASASVLLMNIQDSFSLGLTGWISLQSKGLSQFKSINSSMLSFLYSPSLTSTHDYWKNQILLSTASVLLFLGDISSAKGWRSSPEE